MVSRRSSIVALFALMVMAIGLGHLVAQEKVPTPAQPPAPITADNPLGLTPDRVVFSVANIDKEVAWYEDVLGFKEYQKLVPGTDHQVRRLRIPGICLLDLVWGKGSVRHAPTDAGDLEQGYMHMVFKVQDPDSTYKKFSEKNATMKTTKNKNGGISTILLSDPEGNVIEIQNF